MSFNAMLDKKFEAAAAEGFWLAPSRAVSGLGLMLILGFFVSWTEALSGGSSLRS